MISNCTGFSSVTELVQALRARHISSVELLDLYLRRIVSHNSAINAIVTLDEERTRSAAKKADQLRAKGEDAPLLGLPITVKDLIDVEGWPTTAGIPAQAKAIAKADADIVARLHEAGVFVFAKTNSPVHGADWQASNPLFGRTNNPWDLSRTPGGSTGGGSAALAAGLTSLEIGNDISGSARVPAAFCGVYTHRASELLYPFSSLTTGVLVNPTAPMALQTPLTRHAEDLELVFDVLTKRESDTWHMHVPSARHTRLSNYRVAIMPPLEWMPVDPEIVAAQEQLAAQLSSHGVTVKEIKPQEFGDGREFYKLYRSILNSITSIKIPSKVRRLHALVYRLSGDEFNIAHACGLQATAQQYISWYGQRERYRSAYRRFFKEWDIVLTPVNIVNAFKHTDLPFRKRTLEVNGQKIPYLQQDVYCAISSLCGLPATVFPVEITQGGLPIGLQAIGPYLEDRTPMRFAALVAQEFGGFRCPPEFE